MDGRFDQEFENARTYLAADAECRRLLRLAEEQLAKLTELLLAVTP